MGLVGFPAGIKATLGAAWNGTLGLDPGDILVLVDTGAGGWSEDGTTTANNTTNRLQFRPADPGNSGTARLLPPNGSAFGPTIIGDAIAFGIGADYTFLEVFNDAGTYLFQSFNSTFLTPSPDYNPDIFSSLSAAAVGDINVLNLSDGSTPVPSGGSIDAGSIPYDNDGGGELVTLTVENLGDLPLAISSITVPDFCYIRDDLGDLDGGADTVDGGTSKSLVLHFLGEVPGAHSGDIIINSDDSGEATYTITATSYVEDSLLVVREGITVIATGLTSGTGDFVDAGSADWGDAPVQKTFTVTNEGELDAIFVSVFLPSVGPISLDASSEITGSDITIPASESRTLIVNFATDQWSEGWTGNIRISRVGTAQAPMYFRTGIYIDNTPSDLVDRLTGFPTVIKVVLGSDWSSVLTPNGLEPDDVLYLNYAGAYRSVSGSGGTFGRSYTEDGTLDPNTDTNRIRLFPHIDTSSSDNAGYNYGAVGSIDSLTERFRFSGARNFTTPSVMTYPFLQVWSSPVSTTISGGASIFTSNMTFKPGLFTAMSAAAVGDLNVLDGETPVSDGGSINFGNVEINSETTKTLTLENLGEVQLEVSGAVFSGADAGKFSIAGDSEWAGSDLTMTGGSEIALTIEIDTSEPGPFEATLTISSDDADEGSYEIAFTITVVEEGVGGDDQIAYVPSNTPPAIERLFALDFRPNRGDVGRALKALAVFNRKR